MIKKMTIRIALSAVGICIAYFDKLDVLQPNGTGMLFGTLMFAIGFGRMVEVFDKQPSRHICWIVGIMVCTAGTAYGTCILSEWMITAGLMVVMTLLHLIGVCSFDTVQSSDPVTLRH